MTSEAYRYLIDVELFKIAPCDESASTPYGMQIKRVENFGLFVINVTSNSIAHGAGIRFGDVITHINKIDTKAENTATSKAIKIINKNPSVILRIIKQPSYTLVRETCGEKWGFDVDDNILSSIVYDKGSPAEKANLPLNQAIVSINGVEAVCLNDEHLKIILRRADKQLNIRVMDVSFYIEFLRCLGLEVGSSPEEMARVFDPSRLDTKEHQMSFTEGNTTSSGLGFALRGEGFVIAQRDSLSEEKLKKSGKGENVKMWWISNNPIQDKDDAKHGNMGSPLTRLFKGIQDKIDKRVESRRKGNSSVLYTSSEREIADYTPESSRPPSSDVLNLFGDSQILLSALEASQPPSARMAMSSDLFNTTDIAEDPNAPPIRAASSAVPICPKPKGIVAATRTYSQPISSRTHKGWQRPQYTLGSDSGDDTRDCESITSRDTFDSASKDSNSSTVCEDRRRKQPPPVSPRYNGVSVIPRPRPSPRQNKNDMQLQQQQSQTRERCREVSDSDKAHSPVMRSQSFRVTNYKPHITTSTITKGDVVKSPAHLSRSLGQSIGSGSDTCESSPETKLYARRCASELARKPHSKLNTAALPMTSTPPHLRVGSMCKRSVSAKHIRIPVSPVPTHHTVARSFAQSLNPAYHTSTTNAVATRSSSTTTAPLMAEKGRSRSVHTTPDSVSQMTERPVVRKAHSVHTATQPVARPRAQCALAAPEAQSQATSPPPTAQMRVFMISPDTRRGKKPSPHTPPFKRPDRPKSYTPAHTQSQLQPQATAGQPDVVLSSETESVRHSRETMKHVGGLSRAQYQAESLITSHVVHQHSQRMRQSYDAGQAMESHEVYTQPMNGAWKPSMRSRSPHRVKVQVDGKTN